jgi:hypothetical protein
MDIIKVKSVVSKLVRFFAVAFPGGYKFLAVMLITNFSEASVAELFAEGFFWVLLFLTFSGVPVASMMSSRAESFSNKQKYGAILVSISLLLLFGFAFFMTKIDSVLFVNIALASIFVSIYEFIRKDFFNTESFVEIFITGGVSVVFLFTVYFGFELFSDYLLALSMFCMLLPAWFLHAIMFSNISIESRVTNKKLFSVFSQYALSNGFSTSLAAALPLLLVAEMGTEYSVVMAQVVALSKMLLLVPKAMSASNIPKLRSNGPSWSIVKPYCKVLNIYFLVLTILSAPVAWFYDSNNALVFYLLLLSIQVSQLALPYSNVLAVEGKSKELLIANINGTLMFVVTLIPTYMFFTSGYDRGVIIIFFYLIHNFFKFHLTKNASLVFIK